MEGFAIPMSKLSELLGSSDSEPKTCPLSGEDAIAALRAGFERYTNSHAFDPGDLIVQKDGLTSYSFAGERGGNPAIFIRYEHYDDEIVDRFKPGEPGHNYPMIAPNALAGWLAPDGGVQICAIHSDYYEPFVANEA